MQPFHAQVWCSRSNNIVSRLRRGVDVDHLGCDLSDGRAPRPPHGGLFQRRRLTCVSAETALPCLDRYAKSCVRRDLHHWSQGGSNPRPSACHADALPTAPWPLGFFMSHYLRIGPIWQGGFRTLPSRTQICQGRAITASRADDEPRILPRWCGFGHKILSRRSPRHGGFKGQSRLFGSGSCR